MGYYSEGWVGKQEIKKECIGG